MKWMIKLWKFHVDCGTIIYHVDNLNLMEWGEIKLKNFRI